MVSAEELRDRLAKSAPGTVALFASLVEPWAQEILRNLNHAKAKKSFPKIVNDPVWGVIELYPWEVCLLDSPLMHRLRGIRQLGLAYMVYPGACHSRLEHSLGVLEGAERMIRALERNAGHHRRFGRDLDPHVPEVSEFDRYTIRVAALLHDTGHGPMSHVSEESIKDCMDSAEYASLRNIFRESFEGVGGMAPAELASVLIVMSNPMKAVFEHANFAAAVAARILGANDFPDAGYLSGILSGPLDADKLDYMARDSHHVGLPLGLDLDRLIGKLEVVIITPESAHSPELRRRAEALPTRRYYDMGIALAGVGAYEQCVVGRAILYDRLYHHHKVRCAEAMARI